MNSKRIFRIVMVAVLILAVGFLVSPAAAAKPIMFEMPVDWSGPIDNPCGFEIYATTLGTQHSILWQDEDGNISMGHNFFNITESWAANGKTLDFKYNYPVHGYITEYPYGYIAFLGHMTITIPHEGNVYSATGNVTWTAYVDEYGNVYTIDMVKLAGNWTADPGAICEYFAPE